MTLEEWFGQLRGQMSSSQLTARDFLHCSSRKMYQCQQRLLAKVMMVMSDCQSCERSAVVRLVFVVIP